MLKFAGLVGAAALSAVGAAQAVVVLDKHAPPQPPGQAMIIAEDQAPASGDPAKVAKASDGHYWANARVNGADVKFLVDTGASAVALTTDDAVRLGLAPATLAYNYTVTTASGEARAAKVSLASVQVAGAEVTGVDAFVIEKGLPTSLLGMSFLGRLSSFEATPTELVLRP